MNFAPTAGAVMREFQNTKVIPEIDAYRYSKIAELAQAAGKARAYTVDVETIFENLLQDMTAVRDTVGDGCEMVIAMSAKVAGKLDLAKGGSHILESGTFQQGSVELKVKELDGCPIIRVPSARFQTKYTITRENALDIVQRETGLVFAQVLEHAGVYKRSNEGREAFLRFLKTI